MMTNLKDQRKQGRSVSRADIGQGRFGKTEREWGRLHSRQLCVQGVPMLVCDLIAERSGFAGGWGRSCES